MGAHASPNLWWPGRARIRRTGTCTQRRPIRRSATRTTTGRIISPATGGMRPSAVVLSVRWNLVWLWHSLRSLTAHGGQPAARLHSASSILAACTKPNLVNFGERLYENDRSLSTGASPGLRHRGLLLSVSPLATVAFVGQCIGDSRCVFAFFATGDV